MSFPLQDNDKLIKQTYSVYVFLPEDKGQDITRKWHLSMCPALGCRTVLLTVEPFAAAYFKQSALDDLALIDDIPDVGRIPIPEGLFKSARATKSKRDDPRRSTLGTPTGSEGYPLSSGTGVLCTIFPSSGNGPQTAHAYTQDGSSRIHPAAAAPQPPPPALATEPTITLSPRSSAPHFRPSSAHHHHSPPLQAPPRSVHVSPAPARHHSGPRPPSLVPIEILESCQNTRNLTDQRMVQQLSVSRASSVDPGSRSPIGTGANPGRMTPFNAL